jgi:hypothetical protein
MRKENAGIIAEASLKVRRAGEQATTSAQPPVHHASEPVGCKRKTEVTKTVYCQIDDETSRN